MNIAARISTAALICIAAVTPNDAKAQVTNTPYSMYGYGLLSDRASSMQNQMGGIGYAMRAGRQVNVMNPASYASVDSLTFLFDMGVDVSMLWSKEGKSRDHNTGGGLDYITMQFPITKWLGASIGLLPYSSVGYSFGNEIISGTRENQGHGGINQLYAGVGGEWKGISLGANISYTFGTIVNDIYTNPINSGRTLFEHVMRIRDWDLNVGLQYTTRIAKTERLTIGAAWSPKKSLHGNSWATVQEIVQDSKPDTVGELGLKGNYYTPMSIGGGISWTHERSSRWMAELNFTWQDWKNAAYSPLLASDGSGRVLFDGMNFYNRTKIAAGGEFIPKLRGNYGQRIAYRLGAYYTNDYLNILGNRVKEYGITAGVGLPTPSTKTILNIGFEWKHRATHPVDLLTENYFNITLGVNFNELWFWQRKIK